MVISATWYNNDEANPEVRIPRSGNFTVESYTVLAAYLVKTHSIKESDIVSMSAIESETVS